MRREFADFWNTRRLKGACFVGRLQIRGAKKSDFWSTESCFAEVFQKSKNRAVGACQASGVRRESRDESQPVINHPSTIPPLPPVPIFFVNERARRKNLASSRETWRVRQNLENFTKATTRHLG
jgi:hypothetical protein